MIRLVCVIHIHILFYFSLCFQIYMDALNLKLKIDWESRGPDWGIRGDQSRALWCPSWPTRHLTSRGGQGIEPWPGTPTPNWVRRHLSGRTIQTPAPTPNPGRNWTRRYFGCGKWPLFCPTNDICQSPPFQQCATPTHSSEPCLNLKLKVVY